MTDGHCISSDVSPTSLTFTKEDLLHRLFKHPDFGGPNRVLPTENKTILRLAAEKGDCEVIEVLLAYPDIDVNMSDRYVEPALTAAAQNGKMEAVKLLLQHKDIDMNQMPAGGNWSALKYAKFFNHNEIINLLLSHGAIDYDAEAPSIVPTTAHIDNSQNTTLHPEGEIQFDPFDDDMDGAAIETWLELFGTEEGMKE
ncbi:uncharacterized protein J4E79_009276 [Alternaria viburni]|uniref:uncharacterized protein n=1 Tax=Alternaria viburni TaxID=566460 RepID=UPI0020C4E692|nr:uncharacterized protein J4E79_009276 [Alternaria viburni]KAI4651080.1 hypothetical protein J4E79_009276 [Alternaria viburni]